MDDLIDTLELRSLLEAELVDSEDTNFESIYSRLHGEPSKRELRAHVEERVRTYFSALCLPDEATIYDHLVLSLREKDAIATFNWDPFLWQAMERNSDLCPLPNIFFLHGCAILGYCPNDHTQGRLGSLCRKCGRKRRAVPLLYPVETKDYTKDMYISAQWRALEALLEEAFVVTKLGYGAPNTDVEAMELMSKAWGSWNERPMEEIEIIDRPGCDKDEMLTGFLAAELGVARADLCHEIAAYWKHLEIAGLQPHNPAGHAFRSLTVHILDTYGDKGIAYEEEVSPYNEFPGQRFTTRSREPKIDIVARKDYVTVALISSRWRYRHDRVDMVEEAMAYAPAARRHNPNCRLYACVGEFAPNRLDKVLSNCPPAQPRGALNAAVHFAPQLMGLIHLTTQSPKFRICINTTEQSQIRHKMEENVTTKLFSGIRLPILPTVYP